MIILSSLVNLQGIAGIVGQMTAGVFNEMSMSLLYNWHGMSYFPKI